MRDRSAVPPAAAAARVPGSGAVDAWDQKIAEHDAAERRRYEAEPLLFPLDPSGTASWLFDGGVCLGEQALGQVGYYRADVLAPNSDSCTTVEANAWNQSKNCCETSFSGAWPTESRRRRREILRW